MKENRKRANTHKGRGNSGNKDGAAEMQKGTGFRDRQVWVRTLAWSHCNCLILGKLLYFFEPPTS